MIYENLEFPIFPNRPFFYTNFVSTIDGKVDVPSQHDAYWPIGGEADRAEFVNLRTYADAVVHGRITATAHRTVDTLASPVFAAARAARGKQSLPRYIVLSAHPDEALRRQLANDAGIEPWILPGDDLPGFARNLKEQGIDAALVEGGPHLAASFFAAGLIDEIFLTIAPKVFGGGGSATLTMVEGMLLSPEKSQRWTFVSVVSLGGEVFLRYRSSRSHT